LEASQVKVLGLTAALFVSSCMGCRSNPEKADRFIAHRPSFPLRFGKAVLLYLPNRLIDLADMFHVGYGMGPGFGLEMQATRTLSAGAVTGVDFGVAWLGRNTNPIQANGYGRANFSEWSVRNYPTYEQPSPADSGKPAREQPAEPPYGKITFTSYAEQAERPSEESRKPETPRPESHVWRFPRWDVGVHYHALLDHVYLGFAPDEILDFLVGFTTFDLKRDDY